MKKAVPATLAVAILAFAAILYYKTMLSESHTVAPAGSSELSTKDQAPVSYTELPNGLGLIVQEDHSSPVVSIQAWVSAGSITEEKHLGAGISHILEHMLFKGTERRGNSEIAQTIQGLGGYLNAYTSFDRTVFYFDLPSSGWKTALDVLADAMFHSTLPVEEYGKEQEVIRREFAMGFDDPDRTIQKLLFATAFSTHPYKYPVIGHLDVYNQLTREDVLEYYKKNYVPNNITFVVVGDVKTAEVKAELEKLTSTVARQSLPDVYIPQEPKQLAMREAHETFPTEVTRMVVGFHIPGITHPDLYALDVLALLAGQGNSSRLHQALVEKDPILQEVGAFSYTPAQSGLWAVSATLLPDSKVTRKEVQKKILDLLEQFKKSPVSTAELNKAKRQALTSRAAEFKTVAGRAASLGSSWFTAHDLYFGDNYVRGIQNVTDEDIMRVARAYFTEDNMVSVSLSPLDAKPEGEAAEKAATGATALEKTVLANGSSAVLKQDPKVPLVTIRVTGFGGLLSETPENNGISKLAFRLLDKGTKNRTGEKIAEEVESLGGSLGAEVGNNTFSVAIEVLESDLDKAVDILSDVVLNPTFAAAEVEKEKAKQLADLKIERDQPMSLAKNRLRADLYGNHPYALNPLGTEKSLGGLDSAAISSYYKKLLVNRNLIFSLGGSFDRDKALASLNRHFPSSAIPEGSPVVKEQKVEFGGRGQTDTLSTRKKQAIVQIGYPGVDVQSPDRAALDIVDEALSDLASRLFIRIREKQSLAYFVGSGQLVGYDPGYFLFYAGTEASKADKVRSELLDEIRLMTTNGLEAKEIERARAKLLGQKLIQDQAAGTIAYKGALNELYGLGLDYDNAYIDRVRSITLPEINAVVRSYFSKPNFVCVIVQPELKP